MHKLIIYFLFYYIKTYFVQIEAVLSIVECLSQHPMIITQHQEAAMESLVPRLVLLLAVYNSKKIL